MTSSQHVYEVRPRKDHRGADLISDALPFGRVRNRVREIYSRSHDAVIRVFDESDALIETHKYASEFRDS